MRDFYQVKAIFDKIFQGINGYGPSLQERNNYLDDHVIKNVIYGETPIELLYALLTMDCLLSHLDKAKSFYDLGSGIGNTVIGAYLIKHFEKCVGIELLDSLFTLSQHALQKLEQLDNKAGEVIQFIHENILNIDITAADIVYFHCPSIDETYRNLMEKKMETELKNGAIVLSLIHVFHNKDKFELITDMMVKTAWGQAPMMIYRKK